MPNIASPQDLLQGSNPLPHSCPLSFTPGGDGWSKVMLPRSPIPSLTLEPGVQLLIQAVVLLVVVPQISLQDLDPGNYNRAENSPFMSADSIPDLVPSPVSRSQGN